MKPSPLASLSGICRRRDERDRLRGLIIEAHDLGRQTDMDEVVRAEKLRILKQSAQDVLEGARKAAAQDAGRGAHCLAFNQGFEAGYEVAQREPEPA